MVNACNYCQMELLCDRYWGLVDKSWHAVGSLYLFMIYGYEFNKCIHDTDAFGRAI